MFPLHSIFLIRISLNPFQNVHLSFISLSSTIPVTTFRLNNWFVSTAPFLPHPSEAMKHEVISCSPFPFDLPLSFPFFSPSHPFCICLSFYHTISLTFSFYLSLTLFHSPRFSAMLLCRTLKACKFRSLQYSKSILKLLENARML